VHDRFLVLEGLARLDWGDDAFVWRIRRRRLPIKALQDNEGRR
jgi:hypothetical protein